MACQNVSLMGEGITHPLFVAVDEVYIFLPGAHIILQCLCQREGLKFGILICSHHFARTCFLSQSS
jgi:hypothetical protein